MTKGNGVSRYGGVTGHQAAERGDEGPIGLYRDRGRALGELVDSKQAQYGDSAGRSGAILRTLYPHGIPAHAYDDVMLMVRVVDKLSRIAQRGPDGRDLGGESPWEDICGYSLLGLAKDERRAG